MIVKTKKCQLDKKFYIKMSLLEIVRKQWKYFGIPIAICLLTILYPKTVWFIVIAFLVVILYFLFWLIQFVGVSQMEQNKPLFERLTYEIDSRQIMIKLNAKQGMQLNWENIKEVRKLKDSYILYVSQAQFIHLPFSVFLNDNDLRFFDSLLRRKSLI
jgi:hypothetical protein